MGDMSDACAPDEVNEADICPFCGEPYEAHDRSCTADMDRLQSDIVRWHDREWGDPEAKSAVTVAVKLAEESGEVCGAVVKMLEGRRTTKDVCDEIGDVFIVLAVLADRLGVNLGDVVLGRWVDDVRQRTNPARSAPDEVNEAET